MRFKFRTPHPQVKCPGVAGGCEGFELVGAYDFQQPIHVTSGIANVKDLAENGEVEGKTSNQVTVSVDGVDGDQLKVLVDLCIASKILRSKLRNARLTAVLVDYIKRG